jgi:uncharacterized protein DUF4350
MTTVTGPARPGPGGAAGLGGAAAPRGGPGAAGGWRRWRAPAVLVALILLGGALIALIQAGAPVAGPLDPNDTGPQGTHALAALLVHRGQTVSRATTAADATGQARGGGATLVVTNPGLLSQRQLATLARVRANLLLVAPGRTALIVLAPEVRVAGQAPVFSTAPGCGLPAAALAGPAYLGGQELSAALPGAWRCYPARALPDAGGGQAAAAGASTGGYYSLIRYTAAGRVITVLGTGTAFTNAYLASDGNAALALNLLSGTPRVVWLTPSPAAVAAPAGPRSLTSLVPRPAYLVAAELGVALLLTVAWRMRRFGPLVAEPLPVAVRASETVEGHARLYRARRARDRAAAALRAATLARITARVGLPRAASPEAVCHELAARTGRDPDEISGILFGPVPRDDAALVALATELDSLEGQVLTP